MARTRAEVEDKVCIAVETANGVENRWWRITQPVPSVAFALRGRIGAAIGDTVDVAMREFSRAVDPDAEEALEADTQTLGDAAALRAFRNSRAGKSVVYRLVEEARDHLNEGGRFYAVARTKQGAGSLRVFICEAFGNADEPEIGGGYRVIRATR